MEASAVSGTLGCALLGLAALLTALRVERISRPRVRLAVALAGILVLLAPLGDLSAAGYVRGITGDLSASTLFLAGAACLARLGGRVLIGIRERRALLWLLAGAAAFLYPFALGFTAFDPYALGYGSPALATALLLVALAAWWAGLDAVALVVAVAVVAFLGGAYESRNLWDYLIDPLGCGYALVRLLSRRESPRPAPAA